MTDFYWMHSVLWGVAGFLLIPAAVLAVRFAIIIRRYTPNIRRMFEESPIFSPPAGHPREGAEAVEFPTTRGLTLRGSYLAADRARPKGLVVFCHEFRADRWSDSAYWEFLRDDGFDVFAFDFRNHGASDSDATYQPRHWVTEFELDDLQAALAYLKTLPRSCTLPVGLFGISRGGGTAIGVAGRDSSVSCAVTDGAFPTHTTMLIYMKKWMKIVVGTSWFYENMPNWYLALIRDCVLARVERDQGCRFPRLEPLLRRIAPRPVFVVHGGRDSYIRPEIARQFFEYARPPRELWIVQGARHNACLERAGAEYRERVLGFFRQHLAGEPPCSAALRRERGLPQEAVRQPGEPSGE